MLSLASLLLLPLAIASPVDLLASTPRIVSRQASTNTSSPSIACSLDQTRAPQGLTACGNASLFTTFRSKARFIAPEGWMNDPMGWYQRDDGSYHIGYQAHPRHIQWGNISQASAFSPDLVKFYDADSARSGDGPKTIWPSEIYDIRGVFDGSILKKGVNGYPTIIYTSTFTGPLGATSSPAEMPGAETVSAAWTEDGGASWIKLNYGAGGNPIVYQWPQTNLTGFRDPYVFQSPLLESLLANSTSVAKGNHFMTMSGGLREDAYNASIAGSRLWLYRQTTTGDVKSWTYLGPFIGTPLRGSWSKYSGNYGINYETASVARLNTTGYATDTGSDRDALNVIGFGTEGGRGTSHENHWPLWAAVNYTASANGSISSTILFSGVVDWGRTYAFVSIEIADGRQIQAGWTYEDDENLILAKQQGYQGAFTLFRELYTKITRNVSRAANPNLYARGSWGVRNETDGSTSVMTVGQKIMRETLSAYKSGSTVSNPASRSLAQGYTPFETQPTGRFYAISAIFTFGNGTSPAAGLRVLNSGSEYTDILYNPATEVLSIDRSKSSLIKSYGNDTEIGYLPLWNITSGGRTVRETLNLTVIVDNSVLEVYANDVTIITTRVYPWLSNSTGAGFLTSTNFTSSANVSVAGVELWDGLVNAWPNRAANSSRGLVWDGPANAQLGLWAGI